MQRPCGAGNHGALEEVKDTVAGSDGTKAGMGVASGGVSEERGHRHMLCEEFGFQFQSNGKP